MKLLPAKKCATLNTVLSLSLKYEQIMNSQKTESKLPVFEVFRQLPAKSGLETQYLRKVVGGSVEMNFARLRALTLFEVRFAFINFFCRNELRPT